MSRNKLCSQSLTLIIKSLASQSCGLRKLSLAHQHSGMDYGHAITLSRMLEVNKSLRELNISKNYKMLGKGLLIIFYALQSKNRTLEVLKANDCLCYDEIMVSLGCMLAQNKTLKQLWMLDCEVEKYLREKRFGIIPEAE